MREGQLFWWRPLCSSLLAQCLVTESMCVVINSDPTLTPAYRPFEARSNLFIAASSDSDPVCGYGGWMCVDGSIPGARVHSVWTLVRCTLSVT